MQNIDVVERKLRDYIKTFPQDGEWDEHCEQTLIESEEFAFSILGEYDDSHDDGIDVGFVLGILAMITRDDPRFRQWTNEVLMAALPADECAVIVE